jgi:uncharacterized membrane protein YbhN (UPF0104 family)
MPGRNSARLAAIAAATLVVAACLVYLATRFQWAEPLKVVRDANLLALTAATFCVHFAYISVRTLRWQLVVRDKNPSATFASLYWITAVVVSLSILTPGQVGEAVKVEMLKRRGLGGRLPGLGSFALERVLDIVTIAAFGLVGLAFGSGLSDRFPQLPALAAVLFVAGVASLYFLSHSRASGSPQGWLALLRSGTGTSAIKGKMLALTVLSWCLIGVGWQIALQIVGIDVSLPAVCWLVSLVTFGTLISLMPGGIGLADVVTIQALMGMGASPTAAQAGALILRAYALIVILFGLCHLLVWPFVPRAVGGQES